MITLTTKPYASQPGSERYIVPPYHTGHGTIVEVLRSYLHSVSTRGLPDPFGIGLLTVEVLHVPSVRMVGLAQLHNAASASLAGGIIGAFCASETHVHHLDARIQAWWFRSWFRTAKSSFGHSLRRHVLFRSRVRPANRLAMGLS